MRAAKLAAHFLRYRFRALHPFEVQASLLNACNLKCAYCKCPEIKTALLSTAQWMEMIHLLARSGTYRIKFQGGEPTMRKDFVTLCAAAQKAGMITAVVTNGSIISEQPELLAHLNEVVVSMDSPTPEMHDRHRGTGSHAQAMATLEAARRRGKSTYVNMVIHQDNLHQLEPMLSFCEANGHKMHAQSVMFGLDYYDRTAASLSLSHEQERALSMQLGRFKRAGRALMFAAGSYERAAVWPDFSTLTSKSDGPSSCMAGKFYLHIDANGDVFPCVTTTAGAFKPKNLLRDGFRPALLHAQHHYCGDCRVAYLNERKAVFGLRPAALLEMMRRS